MGCGSSSLKGEKVDDIANNPAPQPLKKTATNFSDVNFAGSQNDPARRGKSIALAPDEQRRVTEISENDDEEPVPSMSKPSAGASDGIVGDTQMHHTADGEKLEPYKSIGADQPLGNTGTTTDQKLSVSNIAGIFKPRKSQPVQPVTLMSDEELMKKVGMTPEEFYAWKNDPKNGVGQHANVENGIIPYTLMGTGFT